MSSTGIKRTRRSADAGSVSRTSSTFGAPFALDEVPYDTADCQQPIATSSRTASEAGTASELLLGSRKSATHDPATPPRKRRRLLTPTPDSGDDSDVECREVRHISSIHQLPTPPQSQRKERLHASEFDLQAALTAAMDSERGAEEVVLPGIYEAALAQHAALERGIVLHLATEGARMAGMIATTLTDRDGSLRASMPNVLTYTSARKMVELGSRKRFGAPQLSQLRWLWDLSPPLGYTISTMRELDGSGKKAKTWGLGIELTVQHHAPATTLELVGGMPPSPGRMSTKTGGRDAMSIVALWTQACETRIAEVRRRLVAFATWQLRESGTDRGHVPLPLPRAALPELSTPMPSPQTATSSADVTHDLLERSSTPSPIKGGGKIVERASNQLERIRAKQAAKRQGLSQVAVKMATGEVVDVRIDSPAERMEGLRERSALSRLAHIADSVHLLFSTAATLSTPPSPSMSLPTPPTRKRRAVPLDEAAALVGKSARNNMSDAEACDALQLLTRVCPGFVTIRDVDRRSWLSLVGEKSLREAKEAIRAALARC